MTAPRPILGDIRRVRAIIRREIGSRYAGDKIGYLWAYIFPLSWMIVIYIAFVIFGRSSPIDTDIVSFLLSGVLPYMGARFAINAIIRARTAYRHILILPQVSLPLVALSIFLLELGNSALMFITLLAVNFVAFGYLELGDPVLFAWGFFLALASGGAFAFLLAVLSGFTSTVSKSVPIIMRPLFYISGVFYVANEVPPRLTRLLQWNPLFHAIELVREGMFQGYSSVLADAWVPVGFVGACILGGLSVQSLGLLSSGSANEEVA